MRLRSLAGNGLVALLLGTGVVGSAGVGTAGAGGPGAGGTPVSMRSVVPAPVTVQPATRTTFRITVATRIRAQAGSAEVTRIGEYLAGILRPSTGFPLPVSAAPAGRPADGISLLLAGAPASVGTEGYQLDVTSATIVIRAQRPAGLFAGVQTLRQLL